MKVLTVIQVLFGPFRFYNIIKNKMRFEKRKTQEFVWGKDLICS